MTETKTHQLYNGEIEIAFYPKSHQYKIDGKRLMGVTTALGAIAKPALVPWAARMVTDCLLERLRENGIVTEADINEARDAHRRHKETAGATGTLVHEWAERFIKEGEHTLPEDERVLNGVHAFLTWVKEHGVHFESSERVVYSREHDYVGTMDAEAVINGERCVIDFKTSKGIWPEMRYQTAAYQKAAEEEGTKYDGDRWIVRFDKETGEFEAVQFGELDRDFGVFLSALDIKRREAELK